MVSFIDFCFHFLTNFQTWTSPRMFSIFTHVMKLVRDTHNEPGLLLDTSILNARHRCCAANIISLSWILVTVYNELKRCSIKLKDEESEIVCETGSDKVRLHCVTFEQHSRLSTCLQTQVELQCKQLNLNHVLLERKRYIKRTSSYEPGEQGWLGFQDLASTLLSSEKFVSV